MFGVSTNHPNHAFAMDDLALVAHLLYRRTDFHLLNLCTELFKLLVSVGDSTPI